MTYFFSPLRCSLVPQTGYGQETWVQNFETTPDARPYSYLKSGAAQPFSTADGANYVAAGAGSYGVHNNTGTAPVVANLDFTPVTFSTDGSTHLSFRLAVIETNTNGGLNLANGSIQVNIGYNGGSLTPPCELPAPVPSPPGAFRPPARRPSRSAPPRRPLPRLRPWAVPAATAWCASTSGRPSTGRGYRLC